MQVRTKIDMLPDEVREEVTRRLLTGSYSSFKNFSLELKERGFDISEQALLRYSKRLRSKEVYQAFLRRIDEAKLIEAAPDKLISIARSSIATLLAETDKTVKEMSTITNPAKKALIAKSLTETTLMQLKCLQVLEALQGGKVDTKKNKKVALGMLLEAFGPEH